VHALSYEQTCTLEFMHGPTEDYKVCIVVCFQTTTDMYTHKVRCVSGTHQVGLSGRFSRRCWAAVEEVVQSLAGGGLLPQLSAMSER